MPLRGLFCLLITATGKYPRSLFFLLFMSNSSSHSLDDLLASHAGIMCDPARSVLIGDALARKEAIMTVSGALATWNPASETGRIPKDTYIVDHPGVHPHVDWTSPTCLPMAPSVFDQLLEDALETLGNKQRLYVLDRVVGADSTCALPTTVVTDRALTALFADNMFRPVPSDIDHSVFAGKPFTILALPDDKVRTEHFPTGLRQEKGKTVDMCIAMDFERRIGIVYGTLYCGAVKKLVFTVLNYLLPAAGILPLHCSANEADDGSVALFLGLSGTGKTTLSNHPGRRLIGDDEHAWNDIGVSNLENGCYAKLIRLRREKEPTIYDAVFAPRPVDRNGVIIENAMVYPDGQVDVDDERIAENSRASYLLSDLSSAHPDARGGHPNTIIFLTADAHGVLPPVAKLSRNQALLWFLMGYTSKLAGTETGITAPVSAFSRFFGGPFMPRNPGDYLALMGTALDRQGPDVYLINTGWSGGPYGIGKRMDIDVTRTLVEAALNGSLREAPTRADTRFHLHVPTECVGVDAALLDPRTTWAEGEAYDRAADTLAKEFTTAFDKAYGKAGIDPAVIAECPGR